MRRAVGSLVALFLIPVCLAAQPQTVVPLRPAQPTTSAPSGGDRATPRKDTRTPEQRQAQQFRRLRVPGKQVLRAVHTLKRQLTWHGRLQGAVRTAKQADKPIVWIQALGNLRGYT